MTDTLSPPQAAPQPQRSKRSRRKRSRWGTVMFIVLLVALGLVATGVLPVRDFLERESAVKAANEQLAEITAENEKLAADVTALASEEEVERIAREQYGYVRPGEIGYVAVLPNETTTASNEPIQPVVTVRNDRSMLQTIWDFITGRDLTDDG